jgi:peptide/nickel transport system substrate-binding protein
MRLLHNSWHGRRTFVLLFALLLPILAACGGAPSPAAQPTTAPAPAAEKPTTAPAPAADQPTSAPAAEQPTSAPAAAGGADTSKFLVFGNSGEPDNIDTMDTFSGQALYVGIQAQELLIDLKPGTLDLVPRLATEWKPNADSSEWTLKLRTDVKFTDGTPFNADAVVFNFKRMAEPDFEFGFRGGDTGKKYESFTSLFGGYKGDPKSLWKDIAKVDDSTVKFSFTQPLALFPNYLAGTYFGIASPDAVKKAGPKYGTPDGGIVGTGPFKFVEWRPGENITMVRNDDYWGEKAKMPGLVIRFLKDAPQRVAELKAGSVDFATNLPPDSRIELKDSPDLQEVPFPAFNIAFLALDERVKPLDDPKVRQAIAHAIDKQAILDSLYGGVGTVATDFLPDGMAWARPDNPDAYAYDPEKAKALLAEAGYPNGFSTMVMTDGTELPLELWYMPVSRPYYPTPKPVAEAYQTYLADVGIKVELKTEDWGVYLDNFTGGKKHGITMLGWTGDYADPNNFLFTHFGPGNEPEAGYKNEQVWDLLGKAGAAPTQEASTQFFKEAGALINKDLPRIPIVHAPPVYAAKKALQGWSPSPTGSESFASVSIQK